MSKQTLAVIVGAAVLFAAAAIGAWAFTGGGDSGTPMMTMPNGSTMPADQMTTGGTMTMEDGSMLDSTDMAP